MLRGGDWEPDPPTAISRRVCDEPTCPAYQKAVLELCAKMGHPIKFVSLGEHQARAALRQIVDDAATGRIITLHGAVQIAQRALGDG
jgi:hypothetical protein